MTTTSRFAIGPRQAASLLALLATFALSAGCQDDSGAGKSPVAPKQDQDSGHGGHHHGPHGGELFVIDGAHIHCEWVGKYDQNFIQFYILAEDEKTPREIKADQLTVTLSGREPVIVEVPAVSPNADGLSSQFEVVSEPLALALKAIGAKMEVTIDGETYSASIPKDPH